MSTQHTAKAAKRMSKAVGASAIDDHLLSSADFINRDLSLLEFFRRVLDEARDESQPLLERLKFIAILSSNLDEFFQIRVAGLKERLANDTRVAGDALTTAELLSEIHTRVCEMVDEQMRCLTEDIIPALKRAGVEIASYASLSEEEKGRMDENFAESIFPLLTPQAVDPTHPFPYISGGSINLGMLAKPQFTHNLRPVPETLAEEVFVRVKIPPTLPRFLPLDDSDSRFLLVEDLIISNIDKLVPDVIPDTCHAFRITRDADLEVREAETDDLLGAMEENLRQRRFGDVVRLEVAHAMPTRMAAYIPESVNITADDIYRIDGPLDATAFFKIAGLDRPDLRDAPIKETPLPELENSSLFDAIRHKDILLHHPFMSYSIITDFLKEAAEDADVLAIKMCLYRIGENSPIAPLLIKASEMGKQVTVLIEIKARFDEENNIEWAKKFEQAGVHVVYGLIGLKTHCKATLIIRREGKSKRLVRYVHIATGNYNPDTSAFYTDLSLLTAAKDIGEDATKLFNYLTVYSQPESFENLVVAPLFLRQRMLELIHREAEHAQEGRPSRIIAKMNRLADAQMVRALYDASRAGVKIDLIIRGVCTLRPGVVGLSENITVRSVVGRLLEHSRLYYFENGGEPEMFTGSSDWMPRNLDRRVEVLAPIRDGDMQKYLKEVFLEAYLKDNTKARELRPDGTYGRVADPDGNAFDSQMSFQTSKNVVPIFGRS